MKDLGTTSPRPRRALAATVSAALLVTVTAAFVVFRPDRAVVDQRVEDTLPDDVVRALGDSPTSPPPTSPPPTSPPADPAPADGPAPAPPGGPSPTDPPTTAPPPAPLGAGEFVGQAGHSVTGRAVALSSQQGPVLVLEDLDSDNGPDLQLYLSPHAGGSVQDGVLLEPLRGNQGTQLYRLPPDVDLTTLGNVVIWCERFSTPFGTATLT